VVVNQQPLGVTPRRLDVWRFETVDIDASLPGYLPWSKSIYLKEPLTKISIQLTPAGRPEAHRPARSTGGGAQRPSSTARSGQ
jgi:hypothetical protein